MHPLRSSRTKQFPNTAAGTGAGHERSRPDFASLNGGGTVPRTHHYQIADRGVLVTTIDNSWAERLDTEYLQSVGRPFQPSRTGSATAIRRAAGAHNKLQHSRQPETTKVTATPLVPHTLGTVQYYPVKTLTNSYQGQYRRWTAGLGSLHWILQATHILHTMLLNN